MLRNYPFTTKKRKKKLKSPLHVLVTECSNQFVLPVAKSSLMTVLLSAPVKKSSLSAVVTLLIMANVLTWLMTFLAGSALALGALSTKWKMTLLKKWRKKKQTRALTRNVLRTVDVCQLMLNAV